MDSLQREDTVGKAGFFMYIRQELCHTGGIGYVAYSDAPAERDGMMEKCLLLRFAVGSCGVDQNTRRSCFLFPYEASRDQRLFLKVRCYGSEFRPLPPERRI